jgi:hypothetical protein
MGKRSYTALADCDDLARYVAAELHRHRERLAAGQAAMPAHGATPLVNFAEAIFDVEARDCRGHDLHQDIVRPNLRHRVVPVDQLFGAAEFENADGFHACHLVNSDRTDARQALGRRFAPAVRVGRGPVCRDRSQNAGRAARAVALNGARRGYAARRCCAAGRPWRIPTVSP